MIPGSQDIVVAVPPVEGAYASEMPNWQFRVRVSAMAHRRSFAYEPFQQCLHGNALLPRFLGEADFGFIRNFDTNGSAPILTLP
jgi:hypothetical protein